MEGFTATYSPDDNKLRLYATSRLPKDLYDRVKAAGFAWAPKQELFVAPMWTPEREDLLLELAGEIEDEDTSLVERAEERADRFADYSDKRKSDAEAAAAAVSAIADNIPLGQPILVGHHSERHARRDAEKIENGMKKAVRMWDTSQYWKDRAAGALRNAKYKERPDVRHRRIKGLESDKRKLEKMLDEYKRYMDFWRTPNLTREAALNSENLGLHIHLPYESYKRLEAGTVSVDEVAAATTRGAERIIAGMCRWIQHDENRLEYERTMLAESGGIVADRFNIEVGGRVLAGREWATVLRVNRVCGAISSLTTNRRYCSKIGIEEVRDYQSPEPGVAEAVKKASKLPPLTNFPADGKAEMTKETWDKIADDYKGTRVAKATAEHGAYRYRVAFGHRFGGSAPVYLSDAKRVDPPAPTPEPEAEPVPPSELDPSSLRHSHSDKEPTTFDTMRKQLKAGVQVVTAPQLFPTPPDLATRMVELAEVPWGGNVLEPSAGTGRLIDALRETYRGGYTITAVEIDPRLCEALETNPETHFVRQGDFLTLKAELGLFDRIIMNPPFANGADIEHIRHALGFLKPGGRLVALCANGPRQNEQLKPLVEDRGGLWEPLPAGAFKESGTMVNAVLLTIDEPEACPECGGEGVKRVRPSRTDGDPAMVDQSCEECDGTGRVLA